MESTGNDKIRPGRVSSEANKILHPEISVHVFSLAASDWVAKNQKEIEYNRLVRMASEQNIVQSRSVH